MVAACVGRHHSALGRGLRPPGAPLAPPLRGLGSRFRLGAQYKGMNELFTCRYTISNHFSPPGVNPNLSVSGHRMDGTPQNTGFGGSKPRRGRGPDCIPVLGRCFIFVREERRRFHAKLLLAWLFSRDLVGFLVQCSSRHKKSIQNQRKRYEIGSSGNTQRPVLQKWGFAGGLTGDKDAGKKRGRMLP